MTKTQLYFLISPSSFTSNFMPRTGKCFFYAVYQTTFRSRVSITLPTKLMTRLILFCAVCVCVDPRLSVSIFQWLIRNKLLFLHQKEDKDSALGHLALLPGKRFYIRDEEKKTVSWTWQVHGQIFLTPLAAFIHPSGSSLFKRQQSSRRPTRTNRWRRIHQRD